MHRTGIARIWRSYFIRGRLKMVAIQVMLGMLRELRPATVGAEQKLIVVVHMAKLGGRRIDGHATHRINS